MRRLQYIVHRTPAWRWKKSRCTSLFAAQLPLWVVLSCELWGGLWPGCSIVGWWRHQGLNLRIFASCFTANKGESRDSLHGYRRFYSGFLRYTPRLTRATFCKNSHLVIWMYCNTHFWLGRYAGYIWLHVSFLIGGLSSLMRGITRIKISPGFAQGGG